MDTKIVLGLGFGDEGKGLVTDFLCSQAENPIVVRFSGGQQCGHTVQIGDKRHVHSNYGSGTLRGVPSFFTEHTSIYLNTMYQEREILRSKGVEPELYVHPLAKVTTPYDVAWNRLTEKKNRHGSCGLGIAATMKRHFETGYKIHAVDLKYPEVAFAKLQRIREYYLDILAGDQVSLNKFKDIVNVLESKFNYLLKEEPMFCIANYDFLGTYDEAIFEGSQGIMLDMDHGIFPNVTYANTTSANVMEILEPFDELPEIYYVTRCYQTRHGNGWMSSSKEIDLKGEDTTNLENEWQGKIRIAELDYDLLNYALDVDSAYSFDCEKNLVVTCTDQRPDFQFKEERLLHYFNGIFYSFGPEANNIIGIEERTI